MKPPKNAQTIKVIAKSMAVIEYLGTQPSGVSLGQLSKQVNIPKPTTFRIVKSLKELGYILQDSKDFTYSLSSKFHFICKENSNDSLYVYLCQESMNRLLERFSETVNLGVAEGKSVRFLAVQESPLPLRMSVPPGHRSPLHATALGKSILAFRKPESLKSFLTSYSFKRHTKNTIIKSGEFMKELEKIRKTGYAVDNQEFTHECTCVAAVIPSADMEPRYAVSISVPSTRVKLERIDEMGKAIVQECKKIEKKELKYGNRLPRPYDDRKRV